jgi:hypothetical protein
MPRTRCAEIAPRVKQLFERSDLHFTSSPFLKQLGM